MIMVGSGFPLPSKQSSSHMEGLLQSALQTRSCHHVPPALVNLNFQSPYLSSVLLHHALFKLFPLCDTSMSQVFASLTSPAPKPL